jgi:hypothetical protein
VEPHFGDMRLGVATAFLWMRPDAELALITNWHVVSGRNHETGQCLHPQAAIPDHLRVHIPYSDRGLPPHEMRVDTVNSNGERLWVEHPKYGKSVDLAALSISIPMTSDYAVMPMNAMKSLPLKQRVGMSVFILGFPFGRMGIGMPVWKQATFASEPYLAPDLDQLYLVVDTASRPGMSGSPVIQRQHGQIELEGERYGRIEKGDGALRFVGVYSGRFHTNNATDAQLGRVWPAKLLTDIIGHIP